ncbi:MAG: prolipoprotein diacylglyceryl transferase, partial [Corynebacterium casei]|nr:prolipoprotein diacylglyceryl transferase [Corynebacterium casei]
EATMVFGFRINAIVSVVVFIIAVIVFFSLKKGQETPEEVDPQYQAKLAEEASEENDEAEATDAYGSAGTSDASKPNF